MEVDVVITIVGAGVLALGLLSEALRRLWLSVPLAATALGVLLGPEVLGVLELGGSSEDRRLLEEVARVTLAFSLTSLGLQFSRDDLRETRRRGALLLTAGMLGMWALTGLGAWLLLDVPIWVGALIGAVLTPTDPVVASALVTGPMAESNLPRRLRRTLQLESGANDGLALPFVLLPVAVLTEASGAAGHWAGEVAQALAVSVVVGIGLGLAAARLLAFSRVREGLERASLYGASLGLALLALGATHLLGGSGVLAAFLAGMAFSLSLDPDVRGEIGQAQSGAERVALVAVFVLFGAFLPWSDWSALGWGGLAFAVWTLLMRRPLVVAAALAPARMARRDVVFVAWFGPIGVAALFYALTVERMGVEQHATVLAAATLAIAASVVAHSVTATPGVRRHAGRSITATPRHPLRGDVDEAP